ncbi:Indigoidine synthase A like protein-domain-containing protein [Protomyces lactucae-debilis]|uniref:Indigoidine synthase A like protein-domain-containing protein n=1 Tax=Protomyces lactucae-debilis TaxID=2754530 RepID=A0A1Y2FCM0_PROLT|nr:Indigoidine synthase A like protein-domain-containing protein [Protomyces lactucae-debilis]ORY81367.1 Indigoidine synthase A like protein-domain-containing protein [Protomyces lactucae-debilis]
MFCTRRTNVNLVYPVTRFLQRCSAQKSRYYSSLVLSPDVKRALAAKKPVVCLESTIITHGMAYPQNLNMARQVESVIRQHGATPATIAILNGKAHVGLQDADLELLASTGQAARKVSRRDLATILADKAVGGTTVSATMILAKRAGIKVFVTGGIGGVHRNAESTMDISNDLNELSRNDVAVVCAGPKAILDIPRTLEYLETMGVTVTTVGQKNLPAFYSRDSGIKSPQMSPSPEHAASIIAANQSLKLESAVLVCVPIPEKAGLDGKMMDSVIQKAVQDADAQGIRGKDSTPFLLAAVSEATKGRSLEANIALVMENARVGAQIAVHLADLENGPTSFAEALMENEEATFIQQPEESVQVLAIGGVAVDITCSVPKPTGGVASLLHTSNPGKTTRSLGGVAANMARAVRQAGQPVRLVTAVGNDTDGTFALEQLKVHRIDTSFTHVSETGRTASYTNIQAGGELVTAVADMDILRIISSGSINQALQGQKGGWAIIDANLSSETFFSALRAAKDQQIQVCFEPTSIAKSAIAFSTDEKLTVFPESMIDMVTPNIHELKSLFDAAKATGYFETASWWTVINAMNIMSEQRSQMEHLARRIQRKSGSDSDMLESGVLQQCIQLLPLMPNIYVTLGKQGVLSLHLSDGVQSKGKTDLGLHIQGHDCAVDIMYYATPETVGGHESDTGAGDTFTGSLIAAFANGRPIVTAVHDAQKAAIAHLSRGTAQRG